MAKPIVVDFETLGIQGRPFYPPKPVGAALLYPGKKPKYLAWGHPTENNCTVEQAKAELSDVWKSGKDLLFQNGKFDLDVAETHMGLKPPPWHKVHDTLFTLFLTDPHASTLSLKPAAERHLGMPPEEQDAVRDWLVANKVIAANGKYGALICRAPGKLVGKYAIGDVVRTLKLHELLYPKVIADGMQEAYDRERKLVPILLANERAGMRVDVPRLEADAKLYEKALLKIDTWLRKQLKSPGLNLDADADVAAALKSSGHVEELPKTPTGRDSVSKKNLTAKFFKDKKIWLGLYYRNALVTVLQMSMRPWLEQALANDGYVFTEWNQVRQPTKGGARSGRITCSRFQNITKDFLDRGDEYGVEGDALIRKHVGLPPLPLVRVYLLPDEGGLFCHRDYNQQELRLVAHYAEGALSEAYNTDPKLDVHDFVKGLMQKATGKEFSRRAVKIVNFQTVYGGGAPALMAGLGIDRKAADALRGAWKAALPDVVALDRELKDRFYAGEHLRTFGGRVYRCKPPAVAKKGTRKGQLVSFEYTALNYLIQPSGADVTKEAIIRYHEHPKKDSRMLVTVHDEINLSAPKKIAKQQNEVLRECMESITLDVPWRTDGDERPSWGEKAAK